VRSFRELRRGVGVREGRTGGGRVPEGEVDAYAFMIAQISGTGERKTL